MPKAIDYIPEERIFAMVVGRSGDGKSVAECSFPKDLLDLDFDYRFGGVAAAIKSGIISGEGIEYKQFPTRSGWKPINDYLMQLESYRLQGCFPHKTVVVDSLTSLTRLLVVSSHAAQGGKTLGNLRISGPADFNFEANGTHQVFDFLRSWPCHILCSAHIVDKYGKLNKSEQYSETGIVGEKLSVRDNLGENVLAYFDNVIRLSRELIGNEIKYSAEFATDLAKNTFGIPPGKVDITNKNFYEVFQAKIKEYRK